MPPERNRIGPYEVLRKLGAGGMGTVYLALDEDGRTVAVKAIHPHVAEDVNGLHRLSREVEATMRVASPYVAELVDADLEGDPPYIVTRYVQGRSLQEVVERRGPLTGEPLRSLGQGLVTALDAIHGGNVVHRDLSPRNVMLADGVPIVIDFGLAQAFDATRITQTMIGTPGFVAPEVIMGERAGPQADIFSWAAIMAFAATGRKCFTGATLMEVVHRTLTQDPDLTGVPRDLLPLLWRCLRKDPRERPSSIPVAPPGETSAGPVTALWTAAGQAREKGEDDLAEELYGEVRQIAVQARDRTSEMFATYQLGSAAASRGDYAAACARYLEVRQIAEELGSKTIEALAFRGLARLAITVGDEDQARTYAENARRIMAEKYQPG
jgi:hypothetical protein